MHAVRPDHQVIGARGPVGEGDIHPASAVVQRSDSQPQPHRDIEPPDLVLHQVVQHGAHDPAGRWQPLFQGRFIKILQVDAIEAEDARTVGDRPMFGNGLDQPQVAIGAQGRPGDGDTGAIDTPFGVQVHQFDRPALSRKADSSRHAADSATHDKHCTHDLDPLCWPA